MAYNGKCCVSYVQEFHIQMKSNQKEKCNRGLYVAKKFDWI